MLIRNILRAIFILLLQVLVLKRIDFSAYEFYYVHIIVYPLIVILLPIKIPNALVVFIAFCLGLFVDIFYDSPGVHTSAIVFIGFIRSYLLKILEPYEGYNVDMSPTLKTMGLSWFLTYASILLLAYMLFYFSVEAFSFLFFTDIMLRTIFSFISSLIILFLYMIIANPKN
jgi:hypothetical protein